MSYRNPQIGEKVRYKGIRTAFHTNVIANADKLEKGVTYSVRSFNINPSWINIQLVELEGVFAYHWFEKVS